jgi:hypothetical protein
MKIITSIKSKLIGKRLICPLRLRLRKSSQARYNDYAKNARISTARLRYRILYIVTKIVTKNDDKQRFSIIMSDIRPEKENVEKLLIIYS